MNTRRMIYTQTLRFDFTKSHIEVLKRMAKGAVLSIYLGPRGNSITSFQKLVEHCRMQRLPRNSCSLMGGISDTVMTPFSNSVSNLVSNDPHGNIFTSAYTTNGIFWYLELRQDFRERFIELFMQSERTVVLTTGKAEMPASEKIETSTEKMESEEDEAPELARRLTALLCANRK